MLLHRRRNAPSSTSTCKALGLSTGMTRQSCNLDPSSHLFHSSMVRFPSALVSRSWKPMTSNCAPSQECCDHSSKDRFLLRSASMLKYDGTWSQSIPGFTTHCSLHPAASFVPFFVVMFWLLLKAELAHPFHLQPTDLNALQADSLRIPHDAWAMTMKKAKKMKMKIFVCITGSRKQDESQPRRLSGRGERYRLMSGNRSPQYPSFEREHLKHQKTSFRKDCFQRHSYSRTGGLFLGMYWALVT